MFRTNKKAPSVDVGRLSSLLAQDTCIRGDVVFDGGMRVDGRIEGNVLGKPDGQGLLVLSEKGTIVGTVKVHDAVINGRVEGDLEVEHFLELQAGARITGNISYRTLKLDCGATVEGKLVRMEGETAAVASEAEEADPGNIVSFAGST
jgi:cytoskeletal protein CcmA (bactofilin family)